MKLIIDTDPGIDDAMAILYAALAPEIELLGLTTIFGNVKTDMATRNALRLVEMAGLDIPVAHGANQPIKIPMIKPSAHVHGNEGFGDVPAQQPKGRATEESAVEFLSRMAQEHKGELVVCPIGPITNIAETILHDPQFAKNVQKIVLMGGAVTVGGNVTDFAEANTFHDPHALNIVLASGADVTIVGLDVTTTTQCDDADFEAIALKSPDLGGFLKRISSFYIDFYESIYGRRTCNLHDPAAVIACTHPHLFEMQKMNVLVEESGERIGQTFEDASGHSVNVCVRCDSKAVQQQFVSMFG